MLRRRLRLGTPLAAVTAVPLGIGTAISNWDEVRASPWNAVSIPPFALPLLMMSAVMWVIWWVLRPGRGMVG